MRNFNVVKVYDHKVTDKHEFVKVDVHKIFSVTYIGVQMFKDKEENIWRQLGTGGYDYQLSEDIDGLLMSQEAQAVLDGLSKAEPQIGHCGSEAGQ